MRTKDDFARQVGSYLLGKGLEVSYVSSREEADLVVRIGKQRLPLLALPMMNDYPKALGTLLTAMYEYSSSKGFVCRPKVTPEDRKKARPSTNTASGSLLTKVFPKCLPRDKLINLLVNILIIMGPPCPTVSKIPPRHFKKFSRTKRLAKVRKTIAFHPSLGMKRQGCHDFSREQFKFYNLKYPIIL